MPIDHTDAMMSRFGIWGDQLLASLHPRRIQLPKGALLRLRGEDSQYAHILETGLVCTSLLLADGRSMMVRMQSSGDLLEIDRMLGCHRAQTASRVLISGTALRIPFHDLQSAMDTDRELRHRFFQAQGAKLLELELLSVCNRSHTLEQRLARHLLQLSERNTDSSIPLTQEQLAQHLGVQRSSVVGAAGALRDKGLIQFRRGAILVLEPARLEAAACECYTLLRTSQVNRSAANTHAPMPQQQVA
jgi:CRP-like cAMP-binding protein